LESEQGKFAKYGAIQNRKLRREVTTISRMTHKNIVRYYQAWVEGASGDTGSTIPEEEDDDDEQENMVDAGDVLATQDRSDSENIDNDASGWWSNSPQDRSDLPKELQSSSDSSSSSCGDATSSSWSDDEECPTTTKDTNTRKLEKPVDNYKRTDSSLSQLLEYENDHGLGVSWYLSLSIPELVFVFVF
jgi:translation initiation factor 2-alpha kinase 4